MTKAPARFSRLQIVLHWIVAALMVTQLLCNRGMEAAFDARMDGAGNGSDIWAILHITLGLAVLALAALRLIVRLSRGVPPPPADNPAFIVWTGHLAHFALYLLMFALPLTGAFAWFGKSEIAAELHEWAALLLWVLIFLHILGALAEHFIFKQHSLLRILGAEEKRRLPTR